jgi:hypothetical protein
MAEIKFKASRKKSKSFEEYRQIIKSGDLKFDMNQDADDVISLYTTDYKKIGIDCDLKTGEFRIMFDEQDFKIY